MTENTAKTEPGDLPSALTGLVDQLAQQPVVEKVILYGSRARGDADDRSDIDLAIAAPDAERRQWLDIVSLVEGVETLLAIDIVRLEEVGDVLKSRICAEGKVLYDRPEGGPEPGKS